MTCLVVYVCGKHMMLFADTFLLKAGDLNNVFSQHTTKYTFIE